MSQNYSFMPIPNSNMQLANASNRQKHGGFTLVEVLVALVVFSVGALSLTYAVSNTAENQLALEHRTFAAWIARNKITELRLAEFPDPGESSDQIRFANTNWQISTQVRAVEVPLLGSMLRQVQVDVSLDSKPEQTMHSLRAVIGQN